MKRESKQRRYSIGVGGVLSEIGLLSPDGGPFRVRERSLLRGLRFRFRTDQSEAKDALRLAVMFGSVRKRNGWVEVR